MGGGRTVHLAVSGDIDMDTVDGLAALLREALAGEDVAEVVLDLAGAGFCDATGIRELATAYSRASASGIRLRVTNVRPLVRRSLVITGLYGLLVTGDRG
ncbi:anti-anti-sigma factor [Paractinoplanes atraurantiacus]|uniref:Anti-sigma factor antagonist n=2 Tax=Paractinoplanes atraurantiacus TaxID=1036182 RepID=A0A285I0G7_9ACTN|nr:anti-anti-sigma factor [Actinoplanes atraurantiacus]